MQTVSCTRQYDLHNSGLAYMRMIRSNKYKYVRHFKANFMDELYDLEADPGEKRNLIRRRGSSQWAPVVKRLGERRVQDMEM